MAKIIVFGGNGFVGSNVMEVLLEEKRDCVSASRSNGLDLKNTKETIEFLKQHNPEFIINCAAHVGSLNYVTEQAANVIADNSRMILGMYEAIAASCPNAIVINPIANCAYPAKADTFIEDNWWDGHLHRSVLSYGSSRRFLWTVSECFQMQANIKTINLLVPNMYGPHDSTDPNKAHALNALISKFVKAKHNNQNEIVIWGTGVAIREWLYAKDFGRIVTQILKNPNMLGLAEPINIAQNFGLSVRELVEIIKTSFNFQGNIRWDASMPDGAPKKVMDDRRFRKVFNEFQFTTFEKGVENTIDYYKSILPY
jgi:GDP-L-fucose synthase